MLHLYFAAPLFTQAERAWNTQLVAELTDAGYSLFVPQTVVKNLATLDADVIFKVDVDGVRTADALVAILDGADADSGTCFECGVAYALGIPIVLVRTDFRGGGDALPGQAVSTVNLMLSQCATRIVHLPDPATSLPDVARAIVAALKALPGSVEPVRRGRIT
jgi:nucleoside 2-deoxyribosyltransferase